MQAVWNRSLSRSLSDGKEARVLNNLLTYFISILNYNDTWWSHIKMLGIFWLKVNDFEPFIWKWTLIIKKVFITIEIFFLFYFFSSEHTQWWLRFQMPGWHVKGLNALSERSHAKCIIFCSVLLSYFGAKQINLPFARDLEILQS